MAEWEIKEKKYDDIILQLLHNRGIFNGKNKKEVELFIKPDFEANLHDPYLLSGMKKAVERIVKAHREKQTIGLFADYDADGIPGAALLYKALTLIGFKVEIFIPNRESGYGLSKEGIDYLISKNCQLIITVDLGISNLKEADYCQKKNIDLIVTDHHLPKKEIPSAYAVINPKKKNEKYPFRELSGCGVAYKVCFALSKHFPKINTNFLKWNLDLVAVSTISDVVPLTGENRIFAKYGLVVLAKTKNIGLDALINIAGIKRQQLNAYSAGFQIGPRINAPGRIDHAAKSYELLITQDRVEAQDLADWLNEKNIARQDSMESVTKEAISIIENEKLYENKIIICQGQWQKGVIGPVASRLADKYFRPIILFSGKEDFLTGSARSIPEVNIVDLIEKTSHLVDKFGGHQGAAGITIKKTNYEKFTKNIIELAKKEIADYKLVKKITIDSVLSERDIELDLGKKIKQLEPFGMGNDKPIFALKNVKITNAKKVGKTEKHLSYSVMADKTQFKAIYFNSDENLNIKSDHRYDIAFSLEIDHWNDKDYIKLYTVDIKLNDKL